MDGIGLATAGLLGAMGAAVAVTATTSHAHQRADELEQAGIEPLGVVVDLTDEEQVLRATAEVSEALGPPTVLVDNAGMTSLSVPAVDAMASGGEESGSVGVTTYAQWRRSLARNLDTAFLTTRSVRPGLRQRRWGLVVMVASATGPVMAMRGEAAYGPAKAGMVGFAIGGRGPRRGRDHSEHRGAGLGPHRKPDRR